jgi:predicted RNA binding protein YcfA (HicA-like mRNA interferase family)
MGKKPPHLKLREVEANLISLGFKFKNQVGSHKQYERPADGKRRRAVVTVDVGKGQFDHFLMKSMIRQSGFSAEEFCTGIVKSN